jgi:hypothetical protein
MPFKLSICSFVLFIMMNQNNLALADTTMPLDLIELLGELSDEDNILEIAMAELAQIRPARQSDSNKQSQSNDSDKATQAGGIKK